MDYNADDSMFDSELGLELKRLQQNPSVIPLDPTCIVECEDTRIATRLSELNVQINDRAELKRRSEVIESFRLNVRC